jgi:hypothetical protein
MSFLGGLLPVYAYTTPKRNDDQKRPGKEPLFSSHIVDESALVAELVSSHLTKAEKPYLDGIHGLETGQVRDTPLQSRYQDEIVVQPLVEK